MTVAKETGTDENPHGPAEEVDHSTAMKQWDRAWTREQDNIRNAYEEQAFAAGEQWPAEIRERRKSDSRPILTFNRLGQFIRQVTGDMRQMRPAIKVVPCDEGADEEVAELISGMIRYIENRCDATGVYTEAADSQVSCGIGHWEVSTEYAEDSTFEQELGVRLIDDQIHVLWDPDAKHATRKDAMWCFTPVSMTREAYEENYPGFPVNDIAIDALDQGWFHDEHVRVVRYWYKVKVKRRLMRMPNGGYQDLAGAPPIDERQILAAGGQVVERDGHEIRWRMMNGTEFISEPMKWPGRYIPVVPVIGCQIRVGSKSVRHGIVRFAMDAQRAYNYARSTQTEAVGLQPLAGWIGTETNFKAHEGIWLTANVKNWPYLPYTPDPRNGNAPPTRAMPPQSSTGISECIAVAEMDMQAVIGIYNASLGARSNETSGIAINRREAQGDTGTFVYMDNFARSIMHTARILVDLIPHVYDTTRMMRIPGADGSERMVRINQPAGQDIGGQRSPVLNDVTVGAYDVRMEMGPSYATKREHAREGMTEFVKAFPPAGPLIADLIAKAQDWPNSDDVADRLYHVLPPNLQVEIAKKNNDPAKMPKPPPPPPPDPVAEANAQAEIAKAKTAVVKARAEQQELALKLQHQELVNEKARLDVVAAQAKAAEAANEGDLKDWMRYVNMTLKTLDQHGASQIVAATEPSSGQ